MPLRITPRKGSPFWWITGTVAGRRIRESTGTGDKRLAAEICAARETRAHRESIHGKAAPRRSFAAVAASYLEHGGPHSDATKARVARLLVFFGPGAAADDIDQAALDRAAAGLLRPNPAPATRLREIISPARAVLTHGALRRMCAVPVFDGGKAAATRTEWLTPAEMDRLLVAAAPHLRRLFAFLAGTGARLGEALVLDWRDVDLRHARATLRDTKNGQNRIVELCPRVLAAMLYNPRAEAAQQRTERRGKPVATVIRARVGGVFLTAAGRPYAARKVQGGGQIKTGWGAAVKRASIERPPSSPITPHGLRHTWATWHYAMHRDLLLLRHEGGWSSVGLVERYAHLAPPGMAEEITAWRAAGTILTHAKSCDEKPPAKSSA